MLGPKALAYGRLTDYEKLVHVTGHGSSLHLAGCTLSGGAHDAVLVADGGAHLKMSGACVVGRHETGCGRDAGFGCIVSGRGSRLEAKGCTFRNASSSGVLVIVGGSAATLVGCAVSGNGVHGVTVLDGGRVKLTDTRLINNTHDGLFVSGVGSRAVAQRCAMADNGGYGVNVGERGHAKLTGCKPGANTRGPYNPDPWSSRQLVLRCAR